MGAPLDRQPKDAPRTVDVTGPRFDVRFEPEGALLELAKPLRLPGVDVEQLSLALGRLRFPLAVGGGAARFRTRRTVARRARVRIELRALPALFAARGVRLRFVGVTREGALRCVLLDDAGVLGFEATPLADGADLVFALRAARAATDGPAPALARVLAALRPLGAVLDLEAGLLRVPRPLRLVLREAMAGHGWRVPEERAVRLAPPQLDERGLVLESASLLAGSAAHEVALREDARALASVLAALDALDLDEARASLARLRLHAGAASERPALRELSAALGVEAGDPRASFELAALPLEDGDVVGASLAASLSLRVALRAGDAEAAASAARRVDACEAAGELAADALRAAARGFDAAHVGARTELLTRAVARAPHDLGLAAEAVEAAVSAGDFNAAERVTQRALRDLLDPGARLAVVRAAAAAARADAAVLALASLWEEGLALAPDDAALLETASRARGAAGDAGGALTLLDRAVASAVSGGEPRLAASLLARAASLASGLGRDDGAVTRLARAAELDAEDAGLLAALAAAHQRLGAADEAAAVYARLLASGPSSAHADALLRAARLSLTRTEPRQARAFLDAARRVAPAHDGLPELSAAVDAAVADGWATSPGSLRALDVFALAGVAQNASDPSAVVRAVVDALRAPAPAAAVPALVAAGRLAAERLAAERLAERLPDDDTAARELRAALTEAVAVLSEHVVDPSDLAALEPHAVNPEVRATLARRAAQLLRGAGQGGAAARALARAGVVRRDAATLRAAIDLAVRAEAWDDAAAIVQQALEVVGDGPARAQLIARAAAIAEKRSV